MGWPHVAGVVGVLMLGVVAVAGNAPTLLDEERGIGVVRGSVLLVGIRSVCFCRPESHGGGGAIC